MRRLLIVTREAVASARSQPVFSIVTILMVAGMVLAVMLTTGRTVGAEQQVLSSIDDVGTRTIAIRAETSAGVTTDVLGRIADIEGIEWAVAFSSATDVTNALIPDGSRVPMRQAFGVDVERLGIPRMPPNGEGSVYASQQALDHLGLVDVAGAVATTAGVSYAVMGRVNTPEFLIEFEPLILATHPGATQGEPVNVLVIIADRPDLVAPVAAAVLSVLAPDDSTQVSVETSKTLAQLRGLIQDQLSNFSRGMVIAMLALTGTLVAVMLYGLVLMRRKDYGRRRALGATRRLIVTLILFQTASLALVGVALGVTIATGALYATHDPLPGVEFTTALVVLSLATALIAALLPAVYASRREPIRELRVA